MIQRHTETEVLDAMSDTPVVLIHGPRQTGKSTLAAEVGRRIDARYVTLDDPLPRSLASRDPQALLEPSDRPLIIDEVQRAPELFLTLKSAVDRDRRPGRFLLTGSANLLSLPKIADSLAGRIAIVDLLPLSQAEAEARQPKFVDALFGGGVADLITDSNQDVAKRIVRGGFPEPFGRASAHRRDAWFADYVRTLLGRDVRDLANIEALDQMPRLLRVIAARSGSALNVLELSSEVRIPNTTLHRYLDLLQAVFLTQAIPAWSDDRATRLSKTPKTFVVDSGLLCHLVGCSESGLAESETTLRTALTTFVALELRKLCGLGEVRPGLFHFRTVRRLEVDFVLESRAGEIAAVQVLPSPRILPDDGEALSFVRDLVGDRFKTGVLLYQGSETVAIGRNLYAVPISALWAG